jgi:hypothetical protein
LLFRQYPHASALILDRQHHADYRRTVLTKNQIDLDVMEACGPSGWRSGPFRAPVALIEETANRIELSKVESQNVHLSLREFGFVPCDTLAA